MERILQENKKFENLGQFKLNQIKLKQIGYQFDSFGENSLKLGIFQNYAIFWETANASEFLIANWLCWGNFATFRLSRQKVAF